MTHTLTITCTVDGEGKIASSTRLDCGKIHPALAGALFGMAAAEAEAQALRLLDSLGHVGPLQALHFVSGVARGRCERHRAAEAGDDHVIISVDEMPGHPP